jgi:beta-phosphoglucomutase-like phosphatase (HAD superfamily)
MRFEAVLFDCDGVLVDSEPITIGVLRDMLEELGWKLSPRECMALFVGKTVKDEAALIEARTGVPLTEAWLAAFRARRNEALERELVAVRNVHAAVATLHARHHGRIACASGADRGKVERRPLRTIRARVCSLPRRVRSAQRRGRQPVSEFYGGGRRSCTSARRLAVG